jgi:hypothetical protein
VSWVSPADQRISCPRGKSGSVWSVAIAVSLTVPDARFDFASCEADVPQHVVIESLKLRDGALHDPLFRGMAKGAHERFAISLQQAGMDGGCRREWNVSNLAHGYLHLFLGKNG